MARGRMISKSLSTSEKWAALYTEAGKLAEFCQSLYPLLVAHADDWGCQQGDVFTIKHLVHPTSPRRLADFERALKYLHNVGLISWYDDPNSSGTTAKKRIVFIQNFSAHQDLKGHDKNRKRPFSEPPKNLSNFALGGIWGKVGESGDVTKEKRREENLTYTVAENPATAERVVEGDSEPDLDDRHVTHDTAGIFIQRFCDLYKKYRHGATYVVRRAKDVPTVLKLIRLFGRQRLEKLAIVLFTTDDPWIANTDRGIGILSVKASFLDGLLSEYEHEHGEIAVAL